mgnify:FL=1|tara:strand:+ start:893 stop:1318 length:426 start_codon:yes stop_codon:yes gene_type:complete
MKLEKNEIMKILPHREPFLFLDSIDITEKGESGIGYIEFSPKESFFKGHFPDNPIVPGVIIIEALAQAAGVVGGQKFIKENRTVLFMSLNSAKFRKPVKPSEKISLHVKKINQVKNVYKFSGNAKVNDKLVTETVFTAMII